MLSLGNSSKLDSPRFIFQQVLPVSLEVRLDKHDVQVGELRVALPMTFYLVVLFLYI